MENTICSNSPKGIWQDSEFTVHVHTHTYNDKSDMLSPNNGKICRSHQSRKEADIFIPWASSQQNYVCIISKLHCTLLSPLLHFVWAAVWTAGGKKEYLCSDKKKKKHQNGSRSLENQSVDFLCLPNSFLIIHSRQPAGATWSHFKE